MEELELYTSKEQFFLKLEDNQIIKPLKITKLAEIHHF